MSTSRHIPPWVLGTAEIVTVGMPFCAFKVLTGFVLADAGPGLTIARVAGYLLMALGAVDGLINLVNLLSLLLQRRRALGVCSTDILFRRRDPVGTSSGQDEVGVAVDVFISFALVALVIGGGLLRRMPSWAISTWDIAVVFNVLGAGVGRLLSAIARRREASR